MGLDIPIRNIKAHEKKVFSHPTFSHPDLRRLSCFFAYLWYPFQRVFPKKVHADYLATLNVFFSKRPSLDRYNDVDDFITTLEVETSLEEVGEDEDTGGWLAEGWIVVNDKSSQFPLRPILCTHML